jgi:hypothetical protein
MIIFSILLFFVLTPGILVTLPKKASKYVVAFTHAVIFAGVYHLFCRWFWHSKMALKKSEGFSEGAGEEDGAWKNMRDWIDKHVDTDISNNEIAEIKDNLKTRLDNPEKTKTDIVDWIQSQQKIKPAGDIDRIKNLISEYRDNKSS